MGSNLEVKAISNKRFPIFHKQNSYPPLCLPTLRAYHHAHLHLPSRTLDYLQKPLHVLSSEILFCPPTIHNMAILLLAYLPAYTFYILCLPTCYTCLPTYIPDPSSYMPASRQPTLLHTYYNKQSYPPLPIHPPTNQSKMKSCMTSSQIHTAANDVIISISKLHDDITTAAAELLL